MAYKGKSVIVASASHLVTELKNFLVTCGWTTEGPSTSPSGQDDDEGFILGWFLNSTGEDSAQDLHLHLGVNRLPDSREFARYDYLDSNPGGVVSAVATTINVQDGALFTAGAKIRIEDEIVIVGTVASNSLTNCQRGWGITSPATHADGKVVHILEQNATGTDNTIPVIEIAAYRDMSTAQVASASGATAWTTTTATFTSDANFDNPSGKWGNDRWNYHTLLKSVTSGKMRWVYDFVGVGSSFTTQKFKTSPSGLAEIINAGFLPGWTRNTKTLAESAYCGQQTGLIMPWTDSSFTYPWTGTLLQEAGTPCYFYGSKDGVHVLIKYAGNWYGWYFGNMVTVANPINTTTTSGVAAGATTIPVTNIALFCVGQKVRIMAQAMADWTTNQDRSAELPAGSWPRLDAEELPQEEVVVATVGVSSFTITSATKYAYSSGALVGEDPRPMMRTASGQNQTGTYWNMYAAGQCFVRCYNSTAKNEIASHASHRQFSRSFHTTGQPYNALFMDGHSGNPYVYSLKHLLVIIGYPGNNYVMQYNEVNWDGNYLNNQQLTARVGVSYWASSGGLTDRAVGRYKSADGFMPMVYYIHFSPPPFGAASEDTFKTMWAGAFETFRIFGIWNNSAVAYYLFGPEIA